MPARHKARKIASRQARKQGCGAEPSFLGFAIADLDVIRYEPRAQAWGEASLLTARGSLG